MVALNQNAVKSFFWLKSENYLIGNPYLLLYTKRKEDIQQKAQINIFP